MKVLVLGGYGNFGARICRALCADPTIALPLSTPWLALSLALYMLAGACWLPVVWLQIRMATVAQNALSTGQALPPQYWRYARHWELLGYPAFAAMVLVFYLMVNKPKLFT